MNEVREVIRRWQADQSLRAVARETGLDRKTVRRYIEMQTVPLGHSRGAVHRS